MPRPTPPILDPYTDQLPDVNNPATWAARTPLFWNWTTGPGYVNLTSLRDYSEGAIDYIETALDGSDTVVAAVAQLNLGFTYGATTNYSIAGSGTYTVPAGAKRLMIEMIGGGGGAGSPTSGGGVARASGGGGAGVEVRHLITGTLAASYAYTVGAAGAGATANNTAGSTGGTTSFGVFTAPGGGGGSPSEVDAAAQFIGAPSTPSASPAGGPNEVRGSKRGGPGVKISTASRMSGEGAPSAYGAGGAPRTTNSASTAANGLSGIGAGSGGGGGVSSVTTDANGGNGVAGLIRITPLF